MNYCTFCITYLNEVIEPDTCFFDSDFITAFFFFNNFYVIVYRTLLDTLFISPSTCSEVVHVIAHVCVYVCVYFFSHKALGLSKNTFKVVLIITFKYPYIDSVLR